MSIRIISVLIIFLVTAFGVTSCSSIFAGLYGMKKVKPVDEETILRYSKKYSIPQTDSYELDISYRTFLTSLDSTLYKEEIKNHYQPLQALYFDKARQLQSFQVNCYAGGFPNLQWNRNEIMTTFPPKQQAPLDTIVPFSTQIKYLNPLSQTENTLKDNYDYVVFVYWNRFMGRQSKRLIRYVQNNSKLATNKKVKIIYVNTDNLFTKEN